MRSCDEPVMFVFLCIICMTIFLLCFLCSARGRVPAMFLLHWFGSIGLNCSGHVPVIFVCNQLDSFAYFAAFFLRCSGHVPAVFRSCSVHVPVMLFLEWLA